MAEPIITTAIDRLAKVMANDEGCAEIREAARAVVDARVEVAHAEAERWAYIGRYECGCIANAMVDGRDDRRADIAREVSDWIREGLIVERRPSALLRQDDRFLRERAGCPAPASHRPRGVAPTSVGGTDG